MTGGLLATRGVLIATIVLWASIRSRMLEKDLLVNPHVLQLVFSVSFGIAFAIYF